MQFQYLLPRLVFRDQPQQFMRIWGSFTTISTAIELLWRVQRCLVFPVCYCRWLCGMIFLLLKNILNLWHSLVNDYYGIFVGW